MVLLFLKYNSYSNQKSKLLSCSNLLFPSFYRLQRFCPYFSQKFKNAILSKYSTSSTTLFTYGIPQDVYIFNTIKNDVLGLLQSLIGELNYFGGKDCACHKVLLKYFQLWASFESQVMLERFWEVETTPCVTL